METEKQYKGLVLVISLVGCVQLQAADALGQFQSPFMCKEGMVQAAAPRKSQSPISASSAADASSLFFPNQATVDAAQQQQGQQDQSDNQGQGGEYAGFGMSHEQQKHDHKSGSCRCAKRGEFLLHDHRHSQVYLSCEYSETPCDCSGGASPVADTVGAAEQQGQQDKSKALISILNQQTDNTETYDSNGVLLFVVSPDGSQKPTEAGKKYYQEQEQQRLAANQYRRSPASDHTLGSQSSVGSDLAADLMASGAGSPKKNGFDNPAYTRGSSVADSPELSYQGQNSGKVSPTLAPASSGADSVQGQQQEASGDKVVAAAAALLGGLSNQGAGNQEQLERIGTPAPSRPGSLRVSGKGSRATSTAQLPSLYEEGEQGQSARGFFGGGISQEQAAALLEPVQTELAATKAALEKTQKALEGITAEQLPTLVSALTEMTDGNNALNAKREEQVKALEADLTQLKQQVAQLQAAQQSQSELLNVTQQSREIAAGSSRRRGLMSIFGLCMRRQPEPDQDQSHTSPHQMDSLHSLPAANDAAKLKGSRTLRRTLSGKSIHSEISEV